MVGVIGAFEGQVVFINAVLEGSPVYQNRDCHFREIPGGGAERRLFFVACRPHELNTPVSFVSRVDHGVACFGQATGDVSAELGVGVRGGKGVTHEENIAFGRYGLRLGGRKPDRPDRQNEEDESFHRLEIHGYAETVRTCGEIEGKRSRRR